MLGWLKKILSQHQLPSSQPTALDEHPEAWKGIFRIYGDPRPLLPLVRQAKIKVDKSTADGDSAKVAEEIREYNKLLDCLVPRLFAATFPVPLGQEYEISEAVISKDYLEYKGFVTKDGPYTIARHIQHSDTQVIALVDILESQTRHKTEVKAQVLESYRGISNRKITIQCTRIPGYDDDWFKKGERSLVFCTSDLTSIGIVGRMPLVKFDGEETLSSFTVPSFWPGFPVLFQDGVCLVPWRTVHAFLIRELEEK